MKKLWRRAAKFFDVPPVQAVHCMKCGTQLPYKLRFRFRPNKIGPCPSCGSTLKLYDMVPSPPAVVRTYPFLEGRVLPPGRGRNAFFIKFEQGFDFFLKTGRWSLLNRLIDRRNNRY